MIFLKTTKTLGSTYWRKVNECCTGFHVTFYVFFRSPSASTPLCDFGSLGLRSVQQCGLRSICCQGRLRMSCEKSCWGLFLFFLSAVFKLGPLLFATASPLLQLWLHIPLICAFNSLFWLWTCLLLPLDLLCCSFLGTGDLSVPLLSALLSDFPSLMKKPTFTALCWSLCFSWAQSQALWPLHFRKARWCLSIHRWIYLTHPLHIPMEQYLQKFSCLRFCSLSSVKYFLKFLPES